MDAVRLRRWDDTAKSADADMPGLAHFVRHLEISAAEHRQAVVA
jgi:predicted HD phosphohydrolase